MNRMMGKIAEAWVELSTGYSEEQVRAIWRGLEGTPWRDNVGEVLGGEFFWPMLVASWVTLGCNCSSGRARAGFVLMGVVHWLHFHDTMISPFLRYIYILYTRLYICIALLYYRFCLLKLMMTSRCECVCVHLPHYCTLFFLTIYINVNTRLAVLSLVLKSQTKTYKMSLTLKLKLF